jgi:hypothetical protein
VPEAVNHGTKRKSFQPVTCKEEAMKGRPSHHQRESFSTQDLIMELVLNSIFFKESLPKHGTAATKRTRDKDDDE